jgi:hypothetical protein
MGRLGSLDDGTGGRERAAGNRAYDEGRIGSGNIEGVTGVWHCLG